MVGTLETMHGELIANLDRWTNRRHVLSDTSPLGIEIPHTQAHGVLWVSFYLLFYAIPYKSMAT